MYPPPFLPNNSGYIVRGMPPFPVQQHPPGLPNVFPMMPPPGPPGLVPTIFCPPPEPVKKPDEAVTKKRNLLTDQLFSQITYKLVEPIAPPPGLEQIKMIVQGLIEEKTKANAPEPAKTLQVNAETKRIITPPPGLFLHPKKPLEYTREELRLIENDMHKAGLLSELPDCAESGEILGDGIYAPRGSETRIATGFTNKERGKYYKPPQRKKKTVAGRSKSGNSTSATESDQPSSSSDTESRCSETTERKEAYKQENEPSSSYGHETYHTEADITLADAKREGNEYVENRTRHDTDYASSCYGTATESLRSRVQSYNEDQPQIEEPATSRYNPAPDVSLDQRSRFAIRNYFCRGLPWTVERRKGTPLEGLSEDEINHLFRKLFIEGCEGVVSTPITSKSRFHDKPTSQIEYQNTIKSGRTDNYHKEENRNHGYDRNGSDRYYGESMNQDYYDDRERRNSTNYDYEDRYRSNQSGSQYDRSNFHDRRTNYNASPRCNEDYEFGSKLFQRHNNRNS